MFKVRKISVTPPCFPGSSASKESVCNAGDPGSILGQEDPLENR